MFVFDYDMLNNYDLLKIFGKITWKYKIDELISKLYNILDEIINKKGYLTIIRTISLTNELHETLKILENCTSCKDKIKGKHNLDRFHEIKKIKNQLTELEKEKEEQGKRRKSNELNRKLAYMD